MALEEKIVKKHLYEWLLDHDAITVPHLGKFETTPTSASIQIGVYKFLPPNKKVTFQTAHDANDTALRDVLMEREKLTVEQANYTISTFVQKVKESLATRQRYELEDFGLLSQLNENTIIFRIDEETNVEGDSYGLPGLYPKPLVHTKEPETVSAHINPLLRTDPDLPPYDDKEEFVPLTNLKNITEPTATSRKDVDEITVEEKRVNRSSNTLVVVLLTALFFVAFVFVFLLITDTNPFWWTADSDASRTKKEVKKQPEPKKEDKKEPEPKKEDKKEPEITKPSIDYTHNNHYINSFAWLPNQPKNLEQILHKTREDKSYAVLGSFDKAENAYSFYNNLAKRNITTACIVAPVEGNTHYRVCLGKYDTHDQALKAGMTFGKQNAIVFFILNY